MTLINEMNNNPDKVIEEIKNGNEKVLTKIYKKVFGNINSYCRGVGINENEGKEAVQDAFETFYRQVLTKKLKLTCTVDTYIISIAKHLLLASERARIKTNNEDITELDNLVDDDEFAETKIKEKKYEIFLEEFNKLEKDCRRVLRHTLRGRSIAEITKIMNYSSEEFTKTKRKRCRRYLIEQIKKNPWYEKLTQTTSEDFELLIWGDDQTSDTSIRKGNERG